jgi:hypothetical protein
MSNVPPTEPFTLVDWTHVPNERIPGATGDSFWRTVQLPDVRLRIVEYPAGYLADHWCERGHVLHLLEGVVAIVGIDEQQLQPGMTCRLTPGHAHRLRTLGTQTAVALIVD